MDKVLSGDYVMPCRAELMSLQTINKKFDGIKTKTAKLETMRNTSKNLSTSDITGKKNSSCCLLFRSNSNYYFCQ